MEPATLFVDFNLEDERGRIPAILEAGTTLAIGEVVVAEDHEGNRCKAFVAEVRAGTPKVAFLALDRPTWDRSARAEGFLADA